MEELSQNGEPVMNFDVSADGNESATVTVSGELDIANVDRLEEAVAPIIERRPRRLVVDVAALRFADSSAIALWVRWASHVEEIELRACSPLLRRVIESMGLEEKLRPTA